MNFYEMPQCMFDMTCKYGVKSRCQNFRYKKKNKTQIVHDKKRISFK